MKLFKLICAELSVQNSQGAGTKVGGVMDMVKLKYIITKKEAQ